MNLLNVPKKLTTDDLPLSAKLVTIINEQINAQVANANQCHGITLNFRDPSYSASMGGYHPVEIRIEIKQGEWVFDYITDFCFDGFPYPELTKEVDWLVQEQRCYTKYTGWLSPSDANDYFKLWQSNFISYVEMDIFEITVSTDGC